MRAGAGSQEERHGAVLDARTDREIELAEVGVGVEESLEELDAKDAKAASAEGVNLVELLAHQPKRLGIVIVGADEEGVYVSKELRRETRDRRWHGGGGGGEASADDRGRSRRSSSTRKVPLLAAGTKRGSGRKDLVKNEARYSREG